MEGNMESDFTIVSHRTNPSEPFVNVYPLGDAHIGSAQFDKVAFEKWIQMVSDDPHGYVVIIGDLLDIATKTSKTNIWEAAMTPTQQKEYLVEALRPIRDRILGVVPGNHEYRMMREIGVNPLYDVCCKLDIEDAYRENACFIKLGVGRSAKKPERPVQYGLVLVHGASKSKHDKFANGIDGADVIFSGHDHNPRHVPGGKMRFDLNASSVNIVPYQVVVVQPFQSYGGYSLRGEYLPHCTTGVQRVRLYSKTKRVDYDFSQA